MNIKIGPYQLSVSLIKGAHVPASENRRVFSGDWWVPRPFPRWTILLQDYHGERPILDAHIVGKSIITNMVKGEPKEYLITGTSSDIADDFVVLAREMPSHKARERAASIGLPMDTVPKDKMKDVGFIRRMLNALKLGK